MTPYKFEIEARQWPEQHVPPADRTQSLPHDRAPPSRWLRQRQTSTQLFQNTVHRRLLFKYLQSLIWRRGPIPFSVRTCTHVHTHELGFLFRWLSSLMKRTLSYFLGLSRQVPCSFLLSTIHSIVGSRTRYCSWRSARMVVLCFIPDMCCLLASLEACECIYIYIYY